MSSDEHSPVTVRHKERRGKRPIGVLCCFGALAHATDGQDPLFKRKMTGEETWCMAA